MLDRLPVTLERFIDYDREISAVLARGLDGHIRIYAVAENDHRRNILNTSRAPAPISNDLRQRVEAIGAQVANALDHVGMLAVELFSTGEDELLVGEIAPRTHKSGHFTFGACVTSQFEQHVRAICGLQLGDPTLMRPTVMPNLLGDAWQNRPPDFENVLAHPGARLHLYGKGKASPGRKMGHALAFDETLQGATEIAAALAKDFDPPGGAGAGSSNAAAPPR